MRSKGRSSLVGVFFACAAMTRNGAKRRAKNNRAAIVPKLVSRHGGTFGVAELNLIAETFLGTLLVTKEYRPRQRK